MWQYRASLVRVVDGDTIIALIDQGFGGRQEESLRLIDVRAPERGQLGYQEVKAFVQFWCDHAAEAINSRWPLIVATQPNTAVDPTERRTLTRYLATVSNGLHTETLNAAINLFISRHPEYPTGL